MLKAHDLGYADCDCPSCVMSNSKALGEVSLDPNIDKIMKLAMGLALIAIVFLALGGETKKG